ncbi:MAG: hypothetical protein LBL74_01735 [Bacteroidales bacterium]|jgi:hypothetical protein|nr:hypothetical protein [Bacteroidales bacterium]
MKKILALITIILCFYGCSNQKQIAQSPTTIPPITIGKDYVAVCITAKTTDKELFDIRKKIIQHSKIRFTNFDVIRGSNGDIYFLSMAVDCRDGYSGEFSHSFEPGDTSVRGFYRNYKKNSYESPFGVGDMSTMPKFDEPAQENPKN